MVWIISGSQIMEAIGYCVIKLEFTDPEGC